MRTSGLLLSFSVGKEGGSIFLRGWLLLLILH